MISDQIPKVTGAMASPKKRRGNRSAKLKQCKLDARREQWLSQVKGKSERIEVTNVSWDMKGGPGCSDNGGSFPLEELVINKSVEKALYGSDSEPNTPSRSSSILSRNDCGQSASTKSSSRSGRSSSSSSGCFSGVVSGEDDGDAGNDDCLDDWETMADELAAAEVKQQEHQHRFFSGSGSTLSEEHEEEITSQCSETIHGTHTSFSEKHAGSTDVLKPYVNSCAWRPDDSFRPRSLPNLSKQFSFGLNSEQAVCSPWGSVNAMPAPTSCPICCEDLDCTDSKFIPCSCGFRLCLFCHKRILEDDGRCPGCRKQYESTSDDKATFGIGD